MREEGFEFVAFFVCAGCEDKGDVAAETVHILADGVQHGLVKLHGGSLFGVWMGRMPVLSRLGTVLLFVFVTNSLWLHFVSL